MDVGGDVKGCKSKGVSVVIPVFNNSGTLQELYGRIVSVVNERFDHYEIVFIDDDSSDNSFEILEQISVLDSNVRVLKFKQNYGQSAAIKAGIENTSNDYIVIMDADLQDRPEFIPQLMDSLEKNQTLMVIVKWRSKSESPFRLLMSKLFYSFSQILTTISYEPDLGVFRVIKREALNNLEKYEHRKGTLLGKLHWVGTPYSFVELDRDPRKHGFSGYTIKKLFSLAIYRLYSFPKYSLKQLLLVGVLLQVPGLFLRNRKSLGLVLKILDSCAATFILGSFFGRIIKTKLDRKRHFPEYEIELYVNMPTREK